MRGTNIHSEQPIKEADVQRNELSETIGSGDQREKQPLLNASVPPSTHSITHSLPSTHTHTHIHTHPWSSGEVSVGGCGRKERKERLVFCFVWLCKKGKPASCENWEHRRNLSMWLKWCLFLILTNLRGAVPNRFLLMYFLPCAFFPFSLLHRTTNSHSQVRGACVCVMVVHVCVCVCG